MTHAPPSAGLLLHPVALLHTRRERRRSKTMEESESRIPTVDKIHVANAIAEMLITHWREVVKHIRRLGVLRVNTGETGEEDERPRNSGLRPSASESFVMKRPAEWSKQRPISAPYDLSQSPVPPSPTPEAGESMTRRSYHGQSTDLPTGRASSRGHLPENQRASLVVQRLRPKGARSLSNGHTCYKTPLAVLSPTVEEAASGGLAARPRHNLSNRRGLSPASTTVRFSAPVGEQHSPTDTPAQRPAECALSRSSTTERPISMHKSPVNPHCKITVPAEADLLGENSMPPSPRPQGLRSSENSVAIGDDPERLQIPYGTATPRDLSRRSESSPRVSLVETVLASPKIITRKQHSDRSFASASESKYGLSRNSNSELRRSMGSSRASHEENIPPASLQTPCTDRGKQEEDDSPSPIAVRQILLHEQGPHSGGPGLRRTKLAVPRSRHIPRGSGSTGHASSPSMSERHSQHEGDPPTDFEDTETPEAHSMRDLGENEKGPSRLRIYDVRKQVVLEPKSSSTIPIGSYFQAHPEGLEKAVPAYAFEDEELHQDEGKLGKQVSPLVASHDHREDGENTESNKHPNVQGSFDSPRPISPPPSTPVSEARPRSQKSIGSAVKAMAARFEGVSNEPSHVPGSMPSPTKPSGIRPQYTVNPSPSRSSKSSPSKLSRLSRSDSVHSGRPPWIAVMHGRSKRLSVGEPHLNLSAPVPESSQSEVLGENCLNSSQGAMAQGTDGAHDMEPFSGGDHGGSEETIAHVGRVVTVAYQPVPSTGIHRGEHTTPPVPHHRQGRENTQGVQQAGFGDYACMPRLPPRSSLRLPPHALKDNATLTACKMEDEPAELSNANHIAAPEAFESQNADVPMGHMIENLQQQLRDKTDEANHLRSLLESGSEADIAMLRGQLRLVGRECLLWRTRAEVAEKRVATFKRLAARVKALRAGEGANNIPGPALHPDAEMNEADDEADIQDEGMRRVEQWLEQDRRMDSSGEHTEDGAVVAARIRESLRAMEEEEERTETTTVAGDVAESHYDREDEGSMSSLNAATTTRAKRPPPQGLCRHRYRSSASDDGEGEGISAAVASMWVAAEGMF